MLIPVVILLGSSALCQVIRGIVTTPPPRDSRATAFAFMTVMCFSLRARRRPCLGGYSEIAGHSAHNANPKRSVQDRAGACQVNLQPVAPPGPDVRGFARVPARVTRPAGRRIPRPGG